MSKMDTITGAIHVHPMGLHRALLPTMGTTSILQAMSMTGVQKRQQYSAFE